jgi:hypothetical protein
MYYHIIIKAQGEFTYYWNYSKDRTISEFLIPFVNGQIISIGTVEGNKLLNLKTVTTISIYRTDFKLEKQPGLIAPSELFSPDIHQYNCTDELLNEVKQLQASPELTSLLQKAFTKPEAQVFVIMKFGDKFLDSAYQGVIKPIIESFSLKSVRIDEVQDSGKITDQVLESIASSRYVLADLSGARPNCYYETGFAHAIGKELILTINKSDVIHFDLAGYRFIQWETEAELRHLLRERFESLVHSGKTQGLPLKQRSEGVAEV